MGTAHEHDLISTASAPGCSGMEYFRVAGSAHPRQLAFALQHNDSLTRDNFLAGEPNAAAVALIDAWPEWPSRTMLLVGAQGSGKSHLATIWAELSGARRSAAHVLTTSNVPAALATGALVVEDLRAGRFDEQALFHLLNLAREEQAFMLITAREAPSTLEIELRDLRSRFRALPAISLLQPDDRLLRALIVKFCTDRQLLIDETVVSYLLTRVDRSYVAVRQAVELLDSEALRLGRPVTRALAAELLRKA